MAAVDSTMALWWILIPLAFLVVFPLFWSGVVWIIAQMGWARFARHYQTDAPPTSRRFRFTSGAVGLSNYNSALHVAIEPEGLHLSVPLPFRPGHPPLLIPWEDIVDVRKRSVLWMTSYALQIGTPHVGTVSVQEKVLQAIREARTDPAFTAGRSSS